MSAVIIRPLVDADIAEVVAFSLRAWRPVHESMAEVLGPKINGLVYPDWAADQAKSVEEVCSDETARVWVAEAGGWPVGFVAVYLHDSRSSGEIEMVAVDPDHQGRGTGTALVEHAVAEIKAAGYPLVEIGTGGDRGHAPARRTYEKAGFTALPLVRYYRASTD